MEKSSKYNDLGIEINPNVRTGNKSNLCIRCFGNDFKTTCRQNTWEKPSGLKDMHNIQEKAYGKPCTTHYIGYFEKSKANKVKIKHCTYTKHTAKVHHNHNTAKL